MIAKSPSHSSTLMDPRKSPSRNQYFGLMERGRSFPQVARKLEHLARPAGQDAVIGHLFAYIQQFNHTIFQNGEDKKPLYSRRPASPRSLVPAFPNSIVRKNTEKLP